MKEARLYAKLTLDFADSPKIAPLSDAAFRQYIEALLWSRRLLTDGFIPDRMVARMFSQDALAELTSNDPDKPSLLHVDGGLHIHDFSEHQTTKGEIAKKREAGRLGGTAKAARVYAESQGLAGTVVAGATEVLKQNPSNTLAKTETETETETSSKELMAAGAAASADYSQEFLQFYSIYPRKTGKRAAWLKWKGLLRGRTVAAGDIIAGAQRFATDPNLPRDVTFIPHPATWLNAGRWEDAPLPARYVETKAAQNLTTVEYFMQQQSREALEA